MSERARRAGGRPLRCRRDDDARTSATANHQRPSARVGVSLVAALARRAARGAHQAATHTRCDPSETDGNGRNRTETDGNGRKRTIRTTSRDAPRHTEGYHRGTGATTTETGDLAGTSRWWCGDVAVSSSRAFKRPTPYVPRHHLFEHTPRRYESVVRTADCGTVKVRSKR